MDNKVLDTQISSEIKELIDTAATYRKRAYCPYSDFRVGASVLTSDGQIYGGCNVENACYSLTVCAERIAIMKAVSEGHKKFKAMAICSDIKGSFKASCGPCRQFIAEFVDDLQLYLVKPDGSCKVVEFNGLLPMAFTPASLQEERDKS